MFKATRHVDKRKHRAYSFSVLAPRL